MDENAWVDFLLERSTDNLLDKAIDDLRFGTHIISERIATKVKWSKGGFNLYLVSIIFMVIMAVTMVLLASSTA